MTDFIPDFPAFLLVFVRVTSFFLLMPLFSHRTIPTSHKLGLGFFLSWVMFYTFDAPVLEIDAAYFMLIIKEALVGLIIGFVSYIMMTAVQIAGGFIDFQLGLAMASVIDPQSGTQSPLMGQYLYTLALFFLLTINGHHLLLDGIYYSYQFIPLDKAWIPLGDQSVALYIVTSVSKMFGIALQMSIPIVGSLFLVDMALGIVARTVPQINIFVVGLPVKLVAGFLLLIAIMSILLGAVTQLFELTLTTMRGLMDLLGGE